MWTITKPTLTGSGTFDTCVEGIRNEAKRNRVKGVRPLVQDAETEFDVRGNAGELYLTAEELILHGTQGDVTADEMEQLYTVHLVRQKSLGRSVYDKLLASAPHGQCPFCGHLPVSTLDHTLPKKRHPVLAITPINLIPSCKDCNHNKGTTVAISAETQFLNAYFDDVSADRWLYAEIVPGSPPGAVFFVTPPNNWTNVNAARVRYHFEQLKLARLYASQAGRQLQNIKRSLSLIHDAGGDLAVSEDLLDRSLSCAAASTNSWEGALYEAAAQSDWYCAGGFNG